MSYYFAQKSLHESKSVIGQCHLLSYFGNRIHENHRALFFLACASLCERQSDTGALNWAYRQIHVDTTYDQVCYFQCLNNM